MAIQETPFVASGGDIRLRQPVPDDVDLLARWGADADFARYQWASEPWNEPQVLAKRFLQRFADMPNNLGDMFMVHSQSLGAIGYVNFRDVRTRTRGCELAAAFCDLDLWSRGYGVQAVWLGLDHLFQTLNLHKVSLRVVAFNTPAIRCYEACGFRREGLLRDSHWLDNRWWDSLLMAVLEDDWAAQRPLAR